jgi:sarcosine oxidase subunit beta
MKRVDADALIVGGGGAGCSAALHLAERGSRVVLLERGLVGSQATGVNYGGVRQQGRHPAELSIARRSRVLWGRMKEWIGTDAEFRPTGHLKLARSAAEEDDLVAYLDIARQHELPLKLFRRAELHQDYPWLGSGVVAGSLADDDGCANPRLLAPALAEAARRAGADIREHSPARSWTGRAHSFEICTDDTQFTAPVLINTAGFWGGAIAESFGEPVPCTPLSPNMIVTEPLPYFIVPNLGVVGGDIYLRQTARGNVVLGGGRGEYDAERAWSRPLPEVTLAGMRRALFLVPRLAQAQIIRTWTGIDGGLPDKIPVLGPSKTTPGLFHAFGFSGHGFQLGPAIGGILAELVIDGKTDIELEAFRPDRFTGAAP